MGVRAFFSRISPSGRLKAVSAFFRKLAAPAVVVGLGLVRSQQAHATSSYSGAMPTGLQPTDLITSVVGESQAWLIPGMAIIVAFIMFVALFKGITRRSSKPVK